MSNCYVTDWNKYIAENLNRIFTMECFKLAIKWITFMGAFLFCTTLFCSLFHILFFVDLVHWRFFLLFCLQEEVATRTKECNIKIMSALENSFRLLHQLWQFLCLLSFSLAAQSVVSLCMHTTILIPNIFGYISRLYYDVDAIESSFKSFVNVSF